MFFSEVNKVPSISITIVLIAIIGLQSEEFLSFSIKVFSINVNGFSCEVYKRIILQKSILFFCEISYNRSILIIYIESEGQGI
ncbi:hypothetical protein CUS07_13030 [Enterococcus faecalis]|nr:hypothetical protein CUS33_01225 [Enterococcus faecalis]PQE57117.1 hypothetical protein CUS07_13030 [Enterococcus faecalis]PQE66964.1 hypothetical protein CUS03_06500 [Enterococcus faecalis]PQF00752.1 hypothetical protein CUS90_02800 [Enterococcus faecalis]PQF53586.1 hypothetical protein CUS66_11715 [Enterococcus faecalis]